MIGLLKCPKKKCLNLINAFFYQINSFNNSCRNLNPLLFYRHETGRYFEATGGNEVKRKIKNLLPRFKKSLLTVIAIITLCTYEDLLHASVFDLPAFLPPGEFSLGLEPEIITSNPSGAGVNLKPRIGTTSFLNWQGIIGTGSGDRGFRLGATADFDWFPDVDHQPGIATPFTLLYNQLGGDNVISYYFSPLVYKSFKGEAAEYIPFISVPFGWTIRNSRNTNFSQFVMGSMFKSPGMQYFRFSVEAGFNMNKSYSYISGGVTWYPSGLDSGGSPAPQSTGPHNNNSSIER